MRRTRVGEVDAVNVVTAWMASRSWLALVWSSAMVQPSWFCGPTGGPATRRARFEDLVDHDAVRETIDIDGLNLVRGTVLQVGGQFVVLETLGSIDHHVTSAIDTSHRTAAIQVAKLGGCIEEISENLCARIRLGVDVPQDSLEAFVVDRHRTDWMRNLVSWSIVDNVADIADPHGPLLLDCGLGHALRLLM
jgi:hypothetical protein